ncbi:MAG: hypothetical protein LUF91_07155 [Oscillospiraceae bacterium]|nr:hypothetical protein [Oscillospiraceae bacterium]
MKRSGIYVALLLIVVVLVAILSVRLFFGGKDTLPDAADTPATGTAEDVSATHGAEDTTPTFTKTGRPVEDSSPTPAPTASPSPTPFPTPTEAPVFETRAPIEDDAAEEQESADPEDTRTRQSGSFRSDTGTGLNLRVDWVAEPDASGGWTLSVSYYAVSYGFQSSRLSGGLVLTVDDVRYSADTPEMNVAGDAQMESLLAEFPAVSVSGDTVSVSATWDYRGEYSGTELDEITASAVLTLG